MRLNYSLYWLFHVWDEFSSPEIKSETAEKYQKNKVKTQDGADNQLLTALWDPADAANEEKQQAKGWFQY